MCPLYLNREPRLKAVDPLNEPGLTWTRRKKAWCSTQHFHRCLQACRDGVSNPYVLSSFCRLKSTHFRLYVLGRKLGIERATINTHVFVSDAEHEVTTLEVDLGEARPVGEREEKENIRNLVSVGHCFGMQVRYTTVHSPKVVANFSPVSQHDDAARGETEEVFDAVLADDGV